ncbi:STAS domain-containing protein [bacterium]|nr:STAS domain-containing protein [bacterium]
MLDLKSEVLSPGEAVIHVAGEVDMNTSPKLRDLFKSASAQGLKTVTVNLAGVAYMDSSGIATLVEMLQILNKTKGRLVLKAMTPQVKAVFEIAHLMEVFEIVE